MPQCRERQCLFHVLHDGILGSTDGRSLRRRLRRGAEDDKNEKKKDAQGVSMRLNSGRWQIFEAVIFFVRPWPPL